MAARAALRLVPRLRFEVYLLRPLRSFRAGAFCCPCGACAQIALLPLDISLCDAPAHLSKRAARLRMVIYTTVLCFYASVHVNLVPSAACAGMPGGMRSGVPAAQYARDI